MPEGASPFKILVADDEPALLGLVNQLLAKAGYRVFLAGTGLAALRLCEKVEPDLIVSDVNMPEMNGFELAKCIRGLLPKPIPVILMSGDLEASASVQEFAQQIKDCSFLQKPFQPGELLQAVSRELQKTRAAG